ncbi:hypothetical protein [Myxococcus stipitatus]|uniref:hypothetical protein n=1 Tax=Myxococcus stipitatus TaxID=83455 RepID=UPI0030CEEE5B
MNWNRVFVLAAVVFFSVSGNAADGPKELRITYQVCKSLGVRPPSVPLLLAQPPAHARLCRREGARVLCRHQEGDEVREAEYTVVKDAPPVLTFELRDDAGSLVSINTSLNTASSVTREVSETGGVVAKVCSGVLVGEKSADAASFAPLRWKTVPASLDSQRTAPSTVPAFEPSPPPARSCCKVCTTGCPCGDSCISCSKTCRKGPGCAC